MRVGNSVCGRWGMDARKDGRKDVCMGCMYGMYAWFGIYVWYICLVYMYDRHIRFVIWVSMNLHLHHGQRH